MNKKEMHKEMMLKKSFEIDEDYKKHCIILKELGIKYTKKMYVFDASVVAKRKIRLLNARWMNGNI